MQPALRLVEPRPASRAGIFSRLHASRAMGAPNAGISAIMERVVGKVVVVDITPDLRRAPVGERVDLHQMKFCVPVYLKRAGPLWGLVAADTGHPCPQLRKLFSQGFYLSEIAASVRIATPK